MGYFDDLIPGADDGTGFSPRGRDPRRFGSGALDGLDGYDLDMARAAMLKHAGQPESAAARGQGISTDAMSMRRPQTDGTGQPANSRPPAVGSRLSDSARMGSHPDYATGSGPAPVRSLSVSIDDNGQTVIHGADADTIKRIAAGLSEKVSPLPRSNGTFILPKRFENEVRDALADLAAIDESRAARRPPGQGPLSGSDDIDRSSQSLAPRNSGNRWVLSTDFQETVDDPRLEDLNKTINQMLKTKKSISEISEYFKGRGGDPARILPSLLKVDEFRKKYPMYKGDYVVDLERISVPAYGDRSNRSMMLGRSAVSGYFNEDEKISNFQDQITIGTREKESEKPKYRQLGDLSAQYESPKDGAGEISSGKNDPGGKSYRKFQFSLRKKIIHDYVKSKEFYRWKKDFENLAPGDKEFDDKWKESYNSNPIEFEKSQYLLAKRIYFDGPASRVKSLTGDDLLYSSDAVKNVVWSTSIQSGQYTDILARSVKYAMEMKSKDPRMDFEVILINRIYDLRSESSLRQSQNWRRVGSDGYSNTMNNTVDRFKRERVDALARLYRERRDDQ